MIKKLFIVIACIASTACLSLHHKDTTRMPGSKRINVKRVVMLASYGLEAACAVDQLNLPENICTYGREALEAATAVVSSDQVYLIKSIINILQTAAHQHVELQPYFEFATQILQGELNAINRP